MQFVSHIKIEKIMENNKMLSDRYSQCINFYETYFLLYPTGVFLMYVRIKQDKISWFLIKIMLEKTHRKVFGLKDFIEALYILAINARPDLVPDGGSYYQVAYSRVILSMRCIG